MKKERKTDKLMQRREMRRMCAAEKGESATLMLQNHKNNADPDK